MRKLLCCFLLVVACGKSETAADPVATARTALAEGSPRRAIAAVRDATSGPALVLRARALVAIEEWGSVEGLIAKVPDGPDKVGLTCLLAGVRKDVSAFRRCEDASKLTYDDAVLGDEVTIALAKSYELEHRPEQAEKALRDLVARRPTAPNRRALVDFFDRQGFVKDAVLVLEEWFAQAPDDPTLKARLAQLLERKVRGDLLDKRYDEAIVAARRVLVLVPQKQDIRYHLADALEGLGQKAEADAERASLKAANVQAPPAVDSFPGMDPNQPVPERKPHQGHAHP